LLIVIHWLLINYLLVVFHVLHLLELFLFQSIRGIEFFILTWVILNRWFLWFVYWLLITPGWLRNNWCVQFITIIIIIWLIELIIWAYLFVIVLFILTFIPHWIVHGVYLWIFGRLNIQSLYRSWHLSHITLFCLT